MPEQRPFVAEHARLVSLLELDELPATNETRRMESARNVSAGRRAGGQRLENEIIALRKSACGSRTRTEAIARASTPRSG